MRLFDGRDTVSFERAGDRVTVLLTGAQIRAASVDIVRQHVTLLDECPEEYQAAIAYTVPAGARTVREAAAEAKTRLAKLQAAQRLAALRTSPGAFAVPFLHPENVVLTGAGAVPVHSGLIGILTPTALDSELFLRGYKALVLSILHARLPFEKLLDGSSMLRDPFSERIAACTTVDEVAALVDIEAEAEARESESRTLTLPRLRHRLTTVLGATAAIASLVLGWFTWSSYAVALPKQEAIIAAQSSFVIGDYGQALTDLRDYSSVDLPKSARYVLAVSSVKLADLSSAQKDAVLNNISTKTDDNTLDYWISLERGDLERALNLAQNVGDDQLTLVAYTDLFQATKLNTAMAGAEKQKRLEEYSKKIEELSARLGGEE
ncbi:type VII secretion protein EssB [Leifsonia sp. C5G2]|uniref:type VII secretion protein EssB n=1 Tax=Leifsonia sp. C5G2 TaxID=2735269 RepID=UPI001585168B|nr:type VII secretion protein EssB [Leifsonia sp. C5G2]NUU08120.1 type VII secretion protein EssB [Leifsonia sp. C5G2]